MSELSISPSKLEQFRLYVTEAYNGTVTKEKAILSIKGQLPWTKKMEFGSAFHSVLELGGKPFFDHLSGLYVVPVESFSEPYILDPQEVAVADKYRAKYPNMIHEIKSKLRINIGKYEVTMNMRIDSMNGLDVHEKKSTDKPPSRDKYEESLQWKTYALATGARRVFYDVFVYDKATPRNIRHEQIIYHAYPLMKTELERWLSLFILFCENENLLEFIKPKIQVFNE